MSTSETGVATGGCEMMENLAFTTEKAVGSRARIGLVVLATDYTVEHEFRRIITMPGVDFYEARIRNSPSITPASLTAMEPLITETAELILPGDELDVLAFGCTSASMVLGEELVGERLKSAKPTAKTTNPISAAFAAFDALGAKRIAVLTPYRRDVNDIVREYIEKRGYTVPVFGSFNEEHDPTAAAIDADSLRNAVATITAGRDVDAVFVSCTSIRLVDAVAGIENDTGIPTTSSNHAMAWHCLRLAGVNDTLTGRGRLFECTL
ncbi:MAG: Asp/Glu racemase [Gammaproteobacteria bacterium]|nr:Asp/Glu racemase [Gammaproteobacteria bacterium]